MKQFLLSTLIVAIFVLAAGLTAPLMKTSMFDIIAVFALVAVADIKARSLLND